ncbi:helix-turn-helix domain-containing protein [candidate division WOR-3 bacterium]|nr:helix-turn-helix domain-containing protein [candidate division WOR-3 bacterium]
MCGIYSENREKFFFEIVNFLLDKIYIILYNYVDLYIIVYSYRILSLIMAISLKRIDPNKFYTIEEISNFLDLSTQTIRKFLREDKIRGKKIGRRWHILGKNIINFIKK